MDSDWAQDHLQVIRTLMERSAVYRRALGPMMIYLGILGIVACVLGSIFNISTPRSFGFYWMAVSLAGLAGAYFLTRRQAMKDREEFWSPPTRRVTQAVLPPVLSGAVVGLMLTLTEPQEQIYSWAMPVTWMLFYGCAIHAAGFFMPRGIKMLGWLFIMGACSILLSSLGVSSRLPMQAGHVIMGVFFGGLQLFYGIYLFATEKPNRAP